VKRLEKLEEVSKSFPGIAGCYAIQAGREIRVMVKPEEISEDDMVLLARNIAKKIENELTYPGQIKVHVLRENQSGRIRQIEVKSRETSRLLSVIGFFSPQSGEI
jgi:ribonuclease Y